MKPKHRRIVTGHTSDGRSIIELDESVEGYLTPTGDAALTALWSTDVFPCNNTDVRDGKALISGLVNKGGSVLRFVDMLPHSRSPFHRTQSLDYGIVIKGEVWMEVDDGVEVQLYPGDVVVQRGTIHAWVNKSDAASLIAFVLLDAQPVKALGQTLQATDMPGIH